MGRPVGSKNNVGNEIAINEDEGPVTIKLTVPGEVYAEYSDLADKQSLTVAELMVHRLQRCKNHTSIKGLYFNDANIRQIETILQKRPIESVEQFLSVLASSYKVAISGFDPISITANQAKRIHLGAYGGKTVQDSLTQIVQTAIAKATGI